jgi:hypothetical protein
MLWSLKLTEFDFVIEHHAGRKRPHVNAISRHVGLMEDSQILCRHSILKEKGKILFEYSGDIN